MDTPILISADVFPLLWKAQLLYLYDNGMINRIEPAPTAILAVESFGALMEAEEQLSLLNDDDFETFVIGSEEDQCKVYIKYNIATADYILSRLFDTIDGNPKFNLSQKPIT